MKSLVWIRDELMEILSEGEMSEGTKDKLRSVAWEVDELCKVMNRKGIREERLPERRIEGKLKEDRPEPIEKMTLVEQLEELEKVKELLKKLGLNRETQSEAAVQEPMSKLHIKYEKDGLMVEAEVQDTQLIKVAAESLLKALPD